MRGGGVLLWNISMATGHNQVRVVHLEAILMFSGSCYERVLYSSYSIGIHITLKLVGRELLLHVAVTSRH
jgi:hypothetical protein